MKTADWILGNCRFAANPKDERMTSDEMAKVKENLERIFGLGKYEPTAEDVKRVRKGRPVPSEHEPYHSMDPGTGEDDGW